MKDEILNEFEAAEVLGLSVLTLRQWRLKGKGPAFLKLGKAVRYEACELVKFKQDSMVKPAAQPRIHPSSCSITATDRHSVIVELKGKRTLIIGREDAPTYRAVYWDDANKLPQLPPGQEVIMRFTHIFNPAPDGSITLDSLLTEETQFDADNDWPVVLVNVHSSKWWYFQSSMVIRFVKEDLNTKEQADLWDSVERIIANSQGKTLAEFLEARQQ